MQVAICDYEQAILNETLFIVEDIIQKKGYDVFCQGFNNVDLLLKSIEKENKYFDIYILDIDMNEINGIEVAKRIREYYTEPIIIFLTNSDAWIRDAFDVQAFNYILKSERNEKLGKVIEKSLKYMKETKTIYYFKQGKNLISILCKDIYYFESHKRKMRIRTKDSEYSYYGTFKEIENKVDNNIFVRVHISFLVNMNHILSFDGKTIVLNNNELIPVGRSYIPIFNEIYMKYLKDRS